MTRGWRLAVPCAMAGLLLMAAACRTPPAPPPAAAPAADVLALRDFTLIDGNGGPPLANAALLAEDGRITWVGPAAQLVVPAGVTALSLSNAYVMPGLIDLHTHVAESDGITQDPRALFTRENVIANLRLYASYGVTTVASMGTDQPLVYDLIAEQRKSRPREARIYTAGRGFTTKGGYPTQPGGIAGVPYEVSAPAEVAPFMTELAAHHPDLVKVWVDDHFKTLPKIALPVSTAIIEAAHAVKLRTVAHVFYLQDAKDLVAAGLDGLAHSVRDQVIDDATVAAMKQRGTWLMSATLAREASMFALATPEPLLSDPFFARAVPDKVQALMRTPEYQKRVTADPHFAEYPTYLKHAQQNLKTLADAGVKFGFGTDTGPPNRFGGYGEHWELALMVEAGLTPSQVITAATKSGAEFLQAPDLGTIERGKWADLLVLAANPLDDIRNSRRINAVYVAGHKVQ
jgi:imidazolonepropionase-like amidohydrolase